MTPLTPLFSWEVSDKTLTMWDRSSCPHSSFTIDWGDGTDPETINHPQFNSGQHVYEEYGVYNVKFSIANGIHPSQPITYQIIVSSQDNFLLTTVELIDINLPRGLTIDNFFAQSSLRKWQLTLATISTDPSKLFEEASWSFLAKQLLSKLVIYDAVVEAMTGMATLGNGSTTTSTNSGTSGETTSIRGPIKRIETGPSVVEFHDVSSLYQSLIQSSSFSANGEATGFLGIVVSDICYLSRTLKVHLPMCSMIKHPIPFKVFKHDKCR